MTQTRSSPARTLLLLRLSACSLLAFAEARADTLHVPGQFRSIQAAMDAALPLDTVLVAPGSYAERIDFHGKRITVQSSAGAATTVIDATGLPGSVASFVSGEQITSVLRGFTLTGGTGKVVNPFSAVKQGGGVLVVNARPLVQDCIVTANTAESGGGVYILRTVEGSSVTGIVMTGCTISDHLLASGLEAWGHGKVVDVSLTDCTISGNVTDFSGGGIRAHQGVSLECTRCTIVDNVARLDGGGISWNGSLGPHPELLLTDCLLAGNRTDNEGGGLSATTGTLSGGASASIVRCRFTGNEAATLGGGMATYANGGPIDVRDCLVAGNTAGTAGGGIMRDLNVPISGCTITGNVAAAGGGIGSFPQGGIAAITNSILWANTPAEISGPATLVAWCDVEGGHAGTGNIASNPQFLDATHGDWRLAPLSPCRDAGDPAYVPVSGELDLYGDPRVVDGRIDLGSDETTFTLDAWTELGHALAGTADPPLLAGNGTLLPGSMLTLSLTGAAPAAAAWLVVGLTPLDLPFKGGLLYPQPSILVPLLTDGAGSSALAAPWPAGVPADFSVLLQAWVQDPGGLQGFTASAALMATAP